MHTSSSFKKEWRKGVKEGAREGCLAYPKSRLWAAVHSEGGGVWETSCWDLAGRRAVSQCLDAEVAMGCVWNMNQGTGFTGNPLTEALLSNLSDTMTLQGKQMRLLKAGDEWLGCSSGQSSGKGSIFRASHHLELIHCTVVCFGILVGRI